jgi:hypothetical protein
MSYCQNNPSECGIVTSYNSGDFYTKEDVYNIISEINASAIDYCKSNPSECGITTSMENDFSTMDNYYFKNNNWHLLDYEALVILLWTLDMDYGQAIKLIWSYNDGEWSAYSYDDTIFEAIQNINISILEKIERKKGYWVLLKGNNPDYISIADPNTGITKSFEGYAKFDIPSKIFDTIGSSINLSEVYTSITQVPADIAIIGGVAQD